MSEPVLVVDDEEVLRNNLVRFLRRAGHEAEGAASAEQALDRLREREFALVITDLKMPGLGGLALLERLGQEHPELLVIVITAYASVDSAVAALRQGAQDYLLKPLSLDEVERRVGRLLEHRALQRAHAALRRELHRAWDTGGLVAESPAMRAVMRLVQRAAATRSAVLIEGESGTGKELVARALHEQSPRAQAPFVAVNLAAQPRELVDATLFGHARGAFTGASARRDGVFRAAAGGTVFLDEVAELPPEVQVKLLRVLEAREVLPLGEDRAVPVDFRLVSASNRPLAAQVAGGLFRADLLYRIEVLRIELPPLRERREDIPPLVARLLARHAAAMGRRPPGVSAEAMALLLRQPWPGNVRELSNALERALLVCDEDEIGVMHLPASPEPAPVTELKAAVEAFERRHVQAVLDRCGGDKQKAAEALGVHLATLYRRLERQGPAGA